MSAAVAEVELETSPGETGVSFLEGLHSVKSIGDYVIAWIEACCVHTIGPKAGQPLLLDEWQKDFIREMYLVYWDGETWRWVYQTILLGVPRGAGKSTLAAALALFALSPFSGRNAPEVVLSSATRGNAKHVYNPARDMVGVTGTIGLSPVLRDLFGANRNRIWCDENRGELSRVSADGKSNFGGNPTFVVRDELHTWITERQVQLSEALQTSLAKQGGQSLAVTTAGYDKSTILGELYDAAVKHPKLERPKPGLMVLRDRDARFLFWWYEAPANLPVDDPETWRIAHPAGWVDIEAIRAQFLDPSISTDEFRRQWLNQWTKSRKAWLPLGLWDSLGPKVDPETGEIHAREIPDGASIQLGLDASQTHDGTSLTWAWAEDDKKPVVTRTRVWAANPDCPHHFFVEGGTIDLRDVAKYIVEELKPRYKITEISFDPRFFDTIAKDLSDAGFKMVPITQGSPTMKDAYNQFYIACRTHKIEHDGDEIVAQHVEGTSGRQTENGWFIDKLRNKFNDACISNVIAHSRARAALKRKRKKYAHSRKEKSDEEAA